MDTTPYEIAARFMGMKEISGAVNNPQIMAMLKLDNKWPENDETPWCSAFVNYIAWLLKLSRSKDLRARSWLKVGIPVDLIDAQIGLDIVVLQRGLPPCPGADVISAPGHVGFYAGKNAKEVFLLGGNQSDTVSIAAFDSKKILSIRRLF